MAEYVKKEEVIKLIREDKVEITPNLLTIVMLAAPNGYSAEDCYKAINDTCDRHIKEIRNLPAADVIERKKGEWIPVTERLPDSSTEYVLCCGSKGGMFVGWAAIKTYDGSGKCTGFQNSGKGRSFTHWMPLPEPPEEET